MCINNLCRPFFFQLDNVDPIQTLENVAQSSRLENRLLTDLNSANPTARLKKVCCFILEFVIYEFVAVVFIRINVFLLLFKSRMFMRLYFSLFSVVAEC